MSKVTQHAKNSQVIMPVCFSKSALQDFHPNKYLNYVLGVKLKVGEQTKVKY
jgi:hypothetical protein